MAFIIVQHLDPDYKGFMPELLQRITRMPVYQVTDNMEVRPGCVYAIPPNRDLSLLHGNLNLLEPAKPRGMRLPIDFFFRSLAEDLQGKSVGVILSGMGSDGTLGLRAIKEKAGLVVVQDPGSAKFDGMPRSAIDAGLADIVAPATELPEKIGQYLSHVHDVGPGGTSVDSTLKSLTRQNHHPDQGSYRPRFFAVQKKHTVPEDRAAHGHSYDQPDRRVCAFSSGKSPGNRPAFQGSCSSVLPPSSVTLLYGNG